MRTFVSAVAVLIGLAMAAVAVPAMWVDRNLVQEDGFVALTAPLGKDPAFQKRLATAAVSGIGFGDQQLPDALANLVKPILAEAAQSLTSMPGYSDAWAETLRRSHRLSFADPRTLPADVDGATSLTLDVAPLVGLVVKRVSESSPVPLKAPETVRIGIGQSNQRQLIERVSAYAPMGSAVAVGSAIAFILAFVAARRKWTVLAGIGHWRPGAGRGVEIWCGCRGPRLSWEPAAATTWRRSSKASSWPPPWRASGRGSSRHSWRGRSCWSPGSCSALSPPAGRPQHRAITNTGSIGA